MTTEKFTADNVAMLLIDHQVGTMGWAHSTAFDEIKANAISLAKTAKALDIPLVLTSSMEEYAQGPLIDELEEIAPEEFASRIRRQGLVNALDDEQFAAAVSATGRKNLIIAGVTNDVCTVYPTLSAIAEGYGVQVVADGGGSPTKQADEVALRRMEIGGADITTTNAVIAELAGDWSSERGQKVLPIIMERMG